MEVLIRNTLLTLVCGDITEQETDVIVNSANPDLLGGGGVDGAIHVKGGQQILKECKTIRKEKWPYGMPTGEAVATTGGALKAKNVIHTVGPIWSGGSNREHELLAKSYKNCLSLALELGSKTISFPSISTGAFGYPIEKACNIALLTVFDFLRKNRGLTEVRFVLHTKKDLHIYEEALKAFNL